MCIAIQSYMYQPWQDFATPPAKRSRLTPSSVASCSTGTSGKKDGSDETHETLGLPGGGPQVFEYIGSS